MPWTCGQLLRLLTQRLDSQSMLFIQKSSQGQAAWECSWQQEWQELNANCIELLPLE